MGQNAGYFNKLNQCYSFFLLFSFKKIALKIDKHVMLSYLLLFNKRLKRVFRFSGRSAKVELASFK